MAEPPATPPTTPAPRTRPDRGNAAKIAVVRRCIRRIGDRILRGDRPMTATEQRRFVALRAALRSLTTTPGRERRRERRGGRGRATVGNPDTSPPPAQG